MLFFTQKFSFYPLVLELSICFADLKATNHRKETGLYKVLSDIHVITTGIIFIIITHGSRLADKEITLHVHVKHTNYTDWQSMRIEDWLDCLKKITWQMRKQTQRDTNLHIRWGSVKNNHAVYMYMIFDEQLCSISIISLALYFRNLSKHGYALGGNQANYHFSVIKLKSNKVTHIVYYWERK